ncbi:MAG: 3'-5' exonuclease [Magnetococcales bacterium]|nr:3'-5' exonuclease [Magnetococcales bacterium]
MFKTVHKLVWAFDAEWVPDPRAGRLLYGLGEEVADEAVMAHMWKQGGAKEEDPQPYLKTIVCRLVSIAAVQRNVFPDGRVALTLLSLPRSPATESGEAEIVSKFLTALGERRPQLVGYNSLVADLRILTQRGICLGLRAPGFAHRPAKPWEGVDYFARGGDWHIDLKEYAAPGWGSGSPSLHELAVLSGIPGKMDVAGHEVPRLWLDGRLEEIIAYNERDALTTYLVWLRMAHFAGLFTSAEYEEEQRRVKEMLVVEAERKSHLREFLAEWERLASRMV